jgi:hypothetical protein
MRVSRFEAERDTPAGPLEHDVLRPGRPLAGEGPVVQAQALGRLPGAALAARGAEIRLGRAQVVPVRLRLDADPLDGYELALDAEQPLDDPLGLLVLSSRAHEGLDAVEDSLEAEDELVVGVVVLGERR